MSRAAGVALFAGILGAACSPQNERAGPAVRDSAGIGIVENTIAAAAAVTVPPFTIDPDPILDLGGGEDGPTFNRIAGVRLAAGGMVYVAEEGESRLRAFDAAGRLQWTAGRRGDGPGEYRRIAGVGVGPSDSVWVWDFGLRRLTFLDPTGRVGRQLSLEAPLSNVGVAGRLGDGTFVLQEYWAAGAADGPGLHRTPAAIVRFATDASALDTVTMLPGREAFYSVEDGRGVMATPLFARRTVATARDDVIFAGDQQRFEIRKYDAAGRVSLLIRLSGMDLSIDERDARDLVATLLETVPPSERQSRRLFLESMDRPAARPAFGALLATDSGALWVEDWTATPGGAGTWTVFSADGVLRGRITMPPGFEPEDVRDDRVAGIWRDALDVEHVRIHRISHAPDAV